MSIFTQLSAALFISLSGSVAASVSASVATDVMPNLGISQYDVEHCIGIKKLADVTHKHKHIVTKAFMYQVVIERPCLKKDSCAFTSENQFTVINMVFSGDTPDRIFNLCLEHSREANAALKETK